MGRTQVAVRSVELARRRSRRGSQRPPASFLGGTRNCHLQLTSNVRLLFLSLPTGKLFKWQIFWRHRSGCYKSNHTNFQRFPDSFQETFNQMLTRKITVILFIQWTLPNSSRQLLCMVDNPWGHKYPSYPVNVTIMRNIHIHIILITTYHKLGWSSLL